MATAMISRPMFLAATLKLRPSLLVARIFSRTAHMLFLFSFFFPFPSYFIRHMSTLAGILKIAWWVGSRRKKRGDCGGGKEEKTGSFFSFLCMTSQFHKQMVNARAASETLHFRSCSCAACVLAWLCPRYITENWNGGNFSAKQPAVRWKTGRSVCPEAGSGAAVINNRRTGKGERCTHLVSTGSWI